MNNARTGGFPTGRRLFDDKADRGHGTEKMVTMQNAAVREHHRENDGRLNGQPADESRDAK